MGLQLTGKWFWSLISDAEVTFFVVGLDWSQMRLYLEKSSRSWFLAQPHNTLDLSEQAGASTEITQLQYGLSMQLLR